MQLKIGRKFLFVFKTLLVSIVGLNLTIAGGVEKESCEGVLEKALASINDPGLALDLEATSSSMLRADELSSEQYGLLDLFALDETKNLVLKSPFLIMNSAQKLLALIYSMGTQRIGLPGSIRQVDYYPFFSEGPKEVAGKKLIGQHEPISELVSGIKAQAQGDKTGNNPILLIGPHGTGKSEILDILRSAYSYFSSLGDEKFASYTFSFHDLHLIPELRKYVHLEVDSEGDEFSYPVKSDLNDSPFAILPTALQEELLKKGWDAVGELTRGMTPRPPTSTDPKSTFIRNAILSHYNEIKKDGDLNVNESLAVLAKHIKLKKIIYDGKQTNTLPTIEFQGKNLDTKGLIATPNLTVQILEGAGASPFSYFYTGKLFAGNGNAMFFDEILRNEPELLNLLLAIFESRVIDTGGIPRIPFDSVIITGTNKANFDALANDPVNHATLDRFIQAFMGYTTRPHTILETLLYMKKTGLWAQKLQTSASEDEQSIQAEFQAFELDKTMRDIIPLPVPGQPLQGPDGRYRIWFKDGNKQIEIAPHALLFMSEIIAATRIVTDTKGKEPLLAPYGIINDPVFKSPILRLKFNEGERQISSALAMELESVLSIVGEGSEEGVPTRQASRWLTAVLAEAGTPEGKNLVTPDIVFKVFKRMIDGERIQGTSVAQTALWKSLAERVSHELLLPRIEGDIHKALASNNSNVENTYHSIWLEIKEQFKNPGATQVAVKGHGDSRQIDADRLDEIKKIFFEIHGRRLDPGQIAVAVDDMGSTDGAEISNVVHPDLHAAVVRYLAKIETKRVSIDDLYEVGQSGQGSDEKKGIFSEFLIGMKSLGYSEAAAIVALDTARRLQNEAARTNDSGR